MSANKVAFTIPAMMKKLRCNFASSPEKLRYGLRKICKTTPSRVEMNKDCSSCEKSFDDKLSDCTSKKSIARDKKNSDKTSDEYSGCIDRKELILLIKCDKSIVINLFNKAHKKNNSQKRQNLI